MTGTMTKTTKKGGSRQGGKIRIATWNINSVRLRIEAISRFTTLYRPDILCLQETKVADEKFPLAPLREMGFRAILPRGEKGYNGVAILSRLPLDGVAFENWGGKGDCRHLKAVLPNGVALHNVYVPAGGDIPDVKANPKFAHKLGFLRDMIARFRGHSGPAILVGDFNIAPLETDVWSHKALLNVVSHTPTEVALLDALKAAAPWHDAVRHFIPPEQRLYTWWSYRSPDWAVADKGRRLDHIWVTKDLSGSLRHGAVARETRGWDIASDHVPAIVDLAF
jgi:exodeoxyribonuclease-3